MKDKGFILIAALAALAYFLWKKYGGQVTTVQSSVVGGVPNMPTTTVYDSSGAVAATSNVIRMPVPANAGPAIYSPSQGWISPPGFKPVSAPHSDVPISTPLVPSTQQRVTPISTRLPVRYTTTTHVNSILASKVATARVN